MNWRAAASLLLAACIAPAFAAGDGFSDVSVGFRYGTDFSEPGVTDASGAQAAIAKRIVNFTWVNGNSRGGNLLVIDGLFSAADDPDKQGDRGAGVDP